MAKKKTKSFKCLFSLLAVATAATVILSSVVLARYSTTAGGSGTSGIATWNVTITPQTNTSTTSGTYDGAFSFGKLSPGTVATTPSESGGYYYFAKNTSDDIKVASLTYTTSVDMKLVISSSDFTITFNDGSTLTKGTTTTVTDTSGGSVTLTTTAPGSYVNGVAERVYYSTTVIDNQSINEQDNKVGTGDAFDYVPTSDDITGLYELDYYLGSTSDPFTKDTTNNNDYHDFDAGSATDSGIYATITWQVKVSSYTTTSTYWATYLCDWVGKYVDNVSCTLTYSAQQNSET